MVNKKELLKRFPLIAFISYTIGWFILSFYLKPLECIGFGLVFLGLSMITIIILFLMLDNKKEKK